MTKQSIRRAAGLAMVAMMTAAPAMAHETERTAPPATERDGCEAAAFADQKRVYYYRRDRFLAAEARWLYCTGRTDSLPAWAR